MMRMLKYLLEKEFKQIRRDRFLPRIIFLLPVIQLVVLPFAANFEMRNINLSIVDNDHTVLSRRLTDKVLSSVWRMFRPATTRLWFPSKAMPPISYSKSRPALKNGWSGRVRPSF